jgi:hypothetical protein
MQQTSKTKGMSKSFNNQWMTEVSEQTKSTQIWSKSGDETRTRSASSLLSGPADAGTLSG